MGRRFSSTERRIPRDDAWFMRDEWVSFLLGDRSKMRQDTDAGASKQHDGDCVVDLQVASILVDDDVAMLVGTERYCAATIGAFRLLLIPVGCFSYRLGEKGRSRMVYEVRTYVTGYAWSDWGRDYQSYII